MIIASCIAIYLVFQKMGIEGYKAFVPFYNLYLLYKHGYKKSMFWIWLGLVGFACLMLLCCVIANIGAISYYAYGGYGYSAPRIGGGFAVFATMAFIAAGVIDIIAWYNIVRSFVEKKGLAVFGIFFQTITLLILGFDRKYQFIGNWQDRKAAANQPKEEPAA